MFQTPTASVQYSSMSRRSTRTSRSGAAGETHSKKKKKSLRRPTPNGTGPARKWAKVLREPVENIGFKTIKWVPTEDLTFDEKIAWDEEQGRQKGSVINDGGKETDKTKDNDASSNGDDADIDDSDLNDSKHIDDEPPLKKVKIELDEDETNQTLLSEQ